MARKPRVEAHGATHHVVANGNGGQEIVRDDADRRRFMARLARAVELHRWRCLAYCLLDTHFHLVLETPEPNLGVGMKWLKASYAQDFNNRHGRRGHVFGGRFYSRVIEREAHLLASLVYVFLNPVRAGLVDRPERWVWSSYASTVGLCALPEFLAADAVLELVDPRPEVARRTLAVVVDEMAARARAAAASEGSDPWGLTPV